MVLNFSTLGHRLHVHFKHVYIAITLNHTTIIFFVVAVIYCLAAIILQHSIHQEDQNAFSTINHVVQAAQVPRKELALFSQNNGNVAIKVCNDTPLVGVSTVDCLTVYEYGSNATADNAMLAQWWNDGSEDVHDLIVEQKPPPRARSTTFQATYNSSGGIDGVNVTSSDGQSVILSKQCTRLLLYPAQILRNCEREDLALLLGQSWLLLISLFAIVYTSIPHILAVILIRILVTIWAGYSIWLTGNLKTWYNILIADPGSPCEHDFFPSFFRDRLALEITDFVLNCVALCLTVGLGLRLIKTWNKATFRRVGAPARIIHIYRIFLAIFVLLQLSLLFLMAVVALWVDTYMNTAIALMSLHTKIYDSLFISTAVTTVPWLTLGWFAVRREQKLLMKLFLLICFLYVVCWGTMFYSQVFRYTFITWPFFAANMVVSFLVLFGTAAAGVLAWLNFGKGLAQFVYIESVLSKADFAGEMFAHNDLKGDELSMSQVQETDKSLEADDDGHSRVITVTSPGGSVLTNPRIYNVDWKEPSKPPIGEEVV